MTPSPGTVGSGIVVVDKPGGLTSHQVVGTLRRLLGTRKVGHAGTLDPMATGVLILGVNRATRLLGHLALHDKSYLATIRLGERSTTDDAEGTVEPVADASHLTLDVIDEACGPLRGHISQVPSSVSAIKVNGQRAYKLVRDGETVQLKSRDVEVSHLEILDVRPGDGVCDVDVDVACSTGTYIRAIARDLGDALGVGGHLTALRRTRIGGYDLSSAVVLQDDAPTLMPMADAARLSFPCVDVSAAQAADILVGRRLEMAVPAEVTGMLSPQDELLALYRPDGDGSRPLAVLVAPEPGETP
ncbi:tRNA pseudouridine(55) synthase TruB [Tessaracoccus antarcticus]|uniref:tRNA pseudouridine synthase B n=1 Tax=Tessaracoccus antarcticus TaxID=2479848 RepID=A0A3M0GB98_9ACTN|nr:tRNA pseudouridine(55) synthase TruB [Tessaracoccus antarcticus]RMB59782.1 tRNA pseudouridine(55) synthase TruB [Tessaracoccus antarcticus]